MRSMLRRQTRRNWRRNRTQNSTLAKPPFCSGKRDHLFSKVMFNLTQMLKRNCAPG